LLAASHPTIWQLIEVLKKEQHLTEININLFIAGQKPPSAKKKKNIKNSENKNRVMIYN